MSYSGSTHHTHHAQPPRGRTAAKTASPESGITRQKVLVIGALIAVAFFVAYSYASAKTTAEGLGYTSDNAAYAAAGGPSAGGAAGAGGCCGSGGAAAGGSAAGSPVGGGGCCGGGGGAPIEGSTVVAGGVQKISVDTSQGSFNPNVIRAKAGVPIEIDFSQAPGGCLSGVVLPDFGVRENLTDGAKTVKLPALSPGEYNFFCQMQMVSAKIVVQ